MATRLLLSVRVLPGGDRIEITFRRRFTQRELEVVKGLRGRRYDGERRVWTVPNGSAAMRVLRDAFGPGGVQLIPTSDPGTPR